MDKAVGRLNERWVNKHLSGGKGEQRAHKISARYKL